MTNSLKHLAYRAVNSLLRPLGLFLGRYELAFTMDGALERAASRTHGIGTVIDVGASNGSWTIKAKRYFPTAQFLLFEPLQERREELRKLQTQLGFIHISSAAGAVRGSTSFRVDSALDGSGAADAGEPGTRIVPVETIDDVVDDKQLKGPYLIKLDTHGYELPILEGATHVLGDSQFLIIEAYNFKLTSNCVRFHELCDWLELKGFRCIDLADPMRRPIDGALWQLDLVFTRADNPAFKSNNYDS